MEISFFFFLMALSKALLRSAARFPVPPDIIHTHTSLPVQSSSNSVDRGQLKKLRLKDKDSVAC